MARDLPSTPLTTIEKKKIVRNFRARSFNENAQDGRGIERPAERVNELLAPWRRAAAPFALPDN
jgi:hypothetical protein